MAVGTSHVSAGPDASARARDLRLAGRGALAAGAASTLQPLWVGALSSTSYLVDMRDPLAVDRWWWVGLVAGAQFAVVGLGLLVLVCGLRQTWPRTTLAGVASAAGVVTGASFLALAATYLVSHSWWAMPDTAAYSSSAEVRGTIAASLTYMGLVLVALACLGTVVWSVGVVRLSRAQGDLGRGASVTVTVVAVAISLGVLAQMAIPFAILHVVLWFTLGAALVRTRIRPPRVRRVSESAV